MPGAFSHNNGLQLNAQQTQQQRLTMKQRLALDVLFLSRQELDAKLSEMLLQNPFIEVEESLEAPADFPEVSAPAGSMTEDESSYEAEIDENCDLWKSDSWEDASSDFSEFPEEETEEGDNGDAWEDESLLPQEFPEETENSSEDFLSYTPAEGLSLQETLQCELNVLNHLSPALRKGAEYIILCLEDNGMLRIPLEDIAMSSGNSLPELMEALELVQSFDPPGIGARSIPECLLLQLKRDGRCTPLFEKLLTELYDELTHNRLETVASKLEISMDELKNMFRILRSLNMTPLPGASSAGAVITPEVEIVPDDKLGFRAHLLKERRSYKLSSDAAKAGASDAGSDFAAKVKEGKNLLEALEFRKSTILRMAEMLIDIQRPFLESGPEKLRPFTMKQAAEYLKFKSESTISRAAASKYVRTPHGVFPFKYFFTTGYISEEGNEVSRTADMELLKKLVDGEDKKHPLSDDRLSKLLNEAGHPVARRTVAKYRDLMNIPSSSLRKEHF